MIAMILNYNNKTQITKYFKDNYYLINYIAKTSMWSDERLTKIEIASTYIDGMGILQINENTIYTLDERIN